MYSSHVRRVIAAAAFGGAAPALAPTWMIGCFIATVFQILACHPDPLATAESDYFGKSSDAVLVQALAFYRDGKVRPADGSVLDILVPAEGGLEVFVGFRATNLHSARVYACAAVEDGRGGRATECRYVSLQPSAELPGWGTLASEACPGSDVLKALLSISVCPGAFASASPLQGVLDLVVDVTDSAGKKGSARGKVSLSCGPGQPSSPPDAALKDENADCFAGVWTLTGGVSRICECQCDPNWTPNIQCR